MPRPTICDIARIVRTALEKMQADGNTEISWISRFPDNCCDHVSHILTYIYVNAGFENIVVLRALVGEHKHVWLRVDDMTVDLTADQFDQCDDPVICSQSSGWHSGLEIFGCKTPGTQSEDARSFSSRWINSPAGEKWFREIEDYIPWCDWLSRQS